MASWWSTAVSLAPEDGEREERARERVSSRFSSDAGDATSLSSLPPADVALITRLHAGDRLALRELFESYFPMLLEHATMLLGQPAAAEDVVADLFAALMEHPSRITPTRSLRAYLIWLVRHRALDRLRGERRAQARYATLARWNDTAVVPGEARLPDELLEAADGGDDRARAVVEALNTLSPRARTIVLLRLRDELDYDEIASILGISRAAVKMQLSRALRAIRARVG